VNGGVPVEIIMLDHESHVDMIVFGMHGRTATAAGWQRCKTGHAARSVLRIKSRLAEV
jgi:hypothetical protein